MPPKQENKHIVRTAPIVEPKEKKEKPEQTDEEFIASFIETKQTTYDRLMKQKEYQENVIECLNSSVKFNHASNDHKAILLNERRKLVSKFTSKIPAQKIQETEKEQINRLTKIQELKKNVMKYDNHYQIQHIHLSTDDYRY